MSYSVLLTQQTFALRSRAWGIMLQFGVAASLQLLSLPLPLPTPSLVLSSEGEWEKEVDKPAREG